MKSVFKPYEFDKSRERIDEILKAKDADFEEVNSIPDREKLTYTNGFYVNCSSLFIDIRGSSELTSKYKRPTLAKLYRAFLSEVVAVFIGNVDCRELNIEGDCVWGVFNTPNQNDINYLFSTAAILSSLIDVLNCKLKNYSIEPINVGIGISYGRALMIKAGYNGSGINEVVWMGDVVNDASKLCGYANSSWDDREIMVSDVFYNNLNEYNKKLLERNYNRNCYHGYVINIDMNNWLSENCK